MHERRHEGGPGEIQLMAHEEGVMESIYQQAGVLKRLWKLHIVKPLTLKKKMAMHEVKGVLSVLDGSQLTKLCSKNIMITFSLY